MLPLDKLSRKALTALGWPELLSALAACTHTARGQARALELPLLAEAADIEANLEQVAQARALHRAGQPLPFGEITDLSPALARLDKEGILDAETLLHVAETLEAGARLRRHVLDRDDEVPGLAELACRLEPLHEVSGPIRDSFDEHGKLADHASPELLRLRGLLRELHDRLTRRMKQLVEEPQIQKWLQDRFYTLREERYVLPVRSDSASQVEGIVHGTSGSGQTLFIEPQEMVGLNNRLKVAENEVLREEVRIFRELSGIVREEIRSILANLEILEKLDLIDARARLAEAMNAGRPRIGFDGQTRLREVRHPLMVLGGAKVVANTIELLPGKGLIITGPNAGGKTVCLKTMGLCALMLRAGMHLPAEEDSTLPLYQAVLVEMGDDQNLSENLSTFTAHLKNLLDFLELGRPGRLLLLDEVGVGTDPREGAALAQALLEGMVETGAQLLITTHFERLKSLPLSDPRFVNASVGFDMTQMQPTYRLHYGLPGTSGALEVARRLGLDPRLAERAAHLLKGESEDLAVLLASLAGERTRTVEEREHLEQATAEARRLEADYTRKLARLKEREEKALYESHASAIEALRAARQKLEQAQRLLREPPTKARVQQADRQIASAAAAIRDHEPVPEAEGRPLTEAEIQPGLRVVMPSLGGAGVIGGLPKRGRVAVLMGGIKTLVSIADLRVPEGKPKGSESKGKDRRPTERAPETEAAPRDPVKEGGVPSITALRTTFNTLDLRGMRVHEGLEEMERFLDNALRSDEPVLFLIHGHGTGSLRAALRQRLDELPFVDSHHPASIRDGGEGVTVVIMR